MMHGGFMVTVVKCGVNMGALPYFNGEKTNRLRMVAFHQDRVTEKFPRLHSLTRIEDVLEMNLFLEHRYAYFGLSGHLFRFHPARRFGVIRPA